MAVRVKVDMYSIMNATLAMNLQDVVKDAKELLEQATGIDHKTMVLKYGKHKGVMATLEDEEQFSELGCFLNPFTGNYTINIMLASPTVEALKVVNRLKALQDEVAFNGMDKMEKDGLTITYRGISLTCQGAELDDTAPEEPSSSAPASAPTPVEKKPASSSTARPADLQGMKRMMKELHAENAEMSYRIKRNTKDLRELLKKCRDMEIDIVLLRPSGEKFTVKGCPSYSVSKFKHRLHTEYGFRYPHQRLIRNNADGMAVELQNTRKLFSYGVENDGDQIYFVMTGGEVVATPQTPAVEVSSSSEEDEIVGTPPMSDDDAVQLHRPGDCDMSLVSIKDYASKSVMFHGGIDHRMDLKGLLDFVMVFESIEDEQKDQLVFSDGRGSPYSWSLTVQQCMGTAGFDGFYLKVRGLSGGALVRGHLSKQQMLDRFKKKSRDFVKQLKVIEDEDDEATYDASIVPQFIHEFMEEKRQQIANASFMASQGRCPVMMALKSTPDDKLLAVEALMKQRLKGASELRVLKSINLMFPTMAVLEQTKLGLTLIQKELATSLLMMYATRYHEEYAGELRYCHSGFLKDLGEELVKRQVRPMAEPERGCVLS
ncbi:unnamed protein product [Effrenium voratum]|uniref:Ubiquitin-like domain-containing protein n=1 Tax=Effrenium voratum TaxID=2562239 RepID=A0AA36HWH9_9DINO|nr:unnamed protein product [Effrenium voratum]